MNAALHRPILPAIVPPRLPWRGALSMLAHRLECELRAGDVPNAAFEHGVDPCDLEALVELWLDEIRRDAPLQTLARQQWFRRERGRRELSFAHRRAARADALPLLLLHGSWGSLVEMAMLGEPLSAPETGPADAFHVVYPALPGFGISPSRLASGRELAAACRDLMRDLGYRRYVVHGSGVGARIAAEVASLDPDGVAAVHVTALHAFPRRRDELDSLTIAEKSQLARLSFDRDQLRRAALSPVTDLAAAATQLSDWDAPLGAFIPLLHSLGVAWARGDALARRRFHVRASFRASPRFEAPVTIETHPLDLPCLSRWVERRFRVVARVEHPRGGELPALETPDRLIASLRKFFGLYR